MKRFGVWIACAAAIFAFLFAQTALAAPKAPAPLPQRAKPALWTAHGPKGTVYLLGSIHVLPLDMKWRTAEIDAALKAADVFVFEIPMNKAVQTEEIQAFVKKNGYLPHGTALPSLLDTDARKDYRAALALTHVSPEMLAPMRPWLALLMLDAGAVTRQNLSAAAGLDRQVYAIALRKRAEVRGFETPEQQLKLLMPADRSLEVEEFDAGLKDLLKKSVSIDDLIGAWAKGDVDKLDRLMNSGFKDNPRAEKALFEDRNRNWVARIEAMLNEKHMFFVTVGAGHLVGPKGVPALLRADGYDVSGP